MYYIITEIKWYKSRLLVIIRVNALLRKGKRLLKYGQVERAKTFFDEARDTIDSFEDYYYKRTLKNENE